MSAEGSPDHGLRVWDPLVRLLHWGLVGAFSTACLSTLKLGIGSWHEPAGYVAMGIVATRLAWGLLARGTGPGRYARFRQFLRGPRATWAYTRQVLAHQEPRHLGHNPLGGWMVLALLAWVGAIAITGWLQTTDRYWGSEALEQVHTLLAWSLLGLIALHVAGVAFTSHRHRENLVKAMWTGRKIPPSGDDVA
jgi:cytochrome b